MKCKQLMYHVSGSLCAWIYLFFIEMNIIMVYFRKNSLSDLIQLMTYDYIKMWIFLCSAPVIFLLWLFSSTDEGFDARII